MANRNTILEGIKTSLLNITVVNGFNNTVINVVRKFVPYDQVFNFPTIMVLGGNEKLEDELGVSSQSKLAIRVVGYTKDVVTPEETQCKLIEDILKCLNNYSYNPYKEKMRIIDIDTDEGMLTTFNDGLTMFVVTLELLYRFDRSAP